MPKTKRLPVLVACAMCPYCDGENVLGSVGPSTNVLGSVGPSTKESNAINAQEIACKHCQNLFTLSEAIIRIRSGAEEKLSATDTAA
jgi:hypothetical protein